MKKYVRIILQIIFIGSLTLSLIPHPYQSVNAQGTQQTDLPVSFQAVHSDSSGIEILLSDPSYKTEKVEINGEIFDQIVTPNAANNATSGQFQLPLTSTLIGVPPQAKISLEIINDTPQEIPGKYRISKAPFPAQLDETDTTQRWDYTDYAPQLAQTNFSYQDSAFTVRIADDAWIRDQRVVRLEYSPFDYRADSGKLIWHPQVRVRVNFDFPFGIDIFNAGVSENQPENSPYEAVLETNLLNFEQATAWRAGKSLNSLDPLNMPQGSLPGLGSRYRIGITEDGIYTVSYATLAAANPGIGTIVSSRLKMSSQGKDVAIQVVDGGDGVFGSGDYVVFYGERFDGEYLANLHSDENQNWYTYLRQDTDGNYFLWKPAFNGLMLEKYTHENVYWLYVGTTNGLRMTTVNSVSNGAPVLYYRETVRAEESYLWSTTRFAGEESWFWERLSGSSLVGTYTTTVTAPTAGPDAIIRSEFVSRAQNSLPGDDHHTSIYLNNPASSTNFYWSGASRYAFSQNISAGNVLEGTNTFVITALTDAQVTTPDLYFDWFEIEYNRSFVADDNAIIFTSPETGLHEYQVTGFTSTTNMQVLDITDPYLPVRVLGAAVDPNVVTFSLNHGDLSIAMAAGGTALSGNQVSYYEPPNWAGMSSGADYVFITHADFWDAAQNLAAYRESTGLSTMVIDVQDLYNEFFYGIYNPIAIKYFLAYAFDNWQTAPTYALLIGDGHFNFHDYYLAKFGVTEQYMPPNLSWVDPWQGEVDSTNLLATVVGTDVFPDLFIGRLPVNSNAEANAYLSKLTAYEGTVYSGSWEQNHTFITENPDSAGDFNQFAEDIIETYIDPYSHASPIRLYQTIYGCTSSGAACDILTQEIKDTINNTGTLIVSYIGHASVDWWSNERTFTYDDIPDLSNSGQLPVVLSMTCLDGFWDITSNYLGSPSSLTEELVRLNNAGAIATFSPTGLGVSSGHDVLHKGFYDSLMVDGNWEIGTAAYQGKLWLYQSGNHYDLIKTYTIYGDPALKIKDPFSFSGTPAANEIVTHSPGSTQTHTITIQNTGSVADTYLVEADYQWDTNVTNMTSEVPPGGSVDIPVEVTTPLAYGVSDMATITVKSKGDQSEVFTSQLTTTIPLDYAYEVSPLSSSKLLRSSSSVEHSFTLTNTGNEVNAYSIDISGNTWPTNASINSTGDLASGEVIQFIVTVDSPAVDDASDSALLSITSLNGLPLLTQIPITSTVPPEFDFSVTPTVDTHAVPPGTSTTYVLTIQNTGQQPDEYQIEFNGNSWPTTISASSTGELDFLESIQVQVTVTTPYQGNLTDMVTVKVSSDSKEIDVALTTSTRQFEIYLPSVTK